MWTHLFSWENYCYLVHLTRSHRSKDLAGRQCQPTVAEIDTTGACWAAGTTSFVNFFLAATQYTIPQKNSRPPTTGPTTIPANVAAVSLCPEVREVPWLVTPGCSITVGAGRPIACIARESWPFATTWLILFLSEVDNSLVEHSICTFTNVNEANSLRLWLPASAAIIMSSSSTENKLAIAFATEDDMICAGLVLANWSVILAYPNGW